jgi:orotidine-5'-phosphate decarboxylase
MDPRSRIFVALDTHFLDEARMIAHEVRPYVGGFKIGSQLFTRSGPTAVDMIGEAGNVFLDLKFNDIPNTVGESAAAAASLGVSFFNVHASAGVEAMQEAVKNKRDSKVLAVTVLTSFNEENGYLTFGAPIKAKVLQFARDAVIAGMDGLVCSAQELEFLAKFPELKGLTRMIPGIRPAWAAANDQKRIMTPADAIGAGATYLVIGRPITNPPSGMSRVEAAQKIVEELAAAA